MNITPGAAFQRLFIEKRKIGAETLKKWNLALAVLLAAQGVAVLLFGTAHELPVNLLYLATDTLQSQLAGQSVTALAMHQLLTINIAYLVAAMLFAAALGSAYVATLGRERYEAGLKKGMNAVRWVAYAVSASALVLSASMLAGMYDADSLALVIVLTVVVAMLGLAIDIQSASSARRKQFGWLVPVAAVVAGLAVWVVIGLYACSAHTFGGATLGSLTYAVLGWGLLAFIGLAVNTHLSDTKKGRWADYMYGEGWYMGLSLVTTSVFAWLVFIVVLRP